MLRATGCRKCGSPLPFLRQERGRTAVHRKQKFLDVYTSEGKDSRHWLETYSKWVRVELVVYRCRRCGREWTESQTRSESLYHFEDRQRTL